MILDDFSLKGKAALVTGGGNGIGGGITKGLAEAGASIACVYRTRPPVEMQRYVEGLGRRFLPIQADVGQMPQLKAIMEQTLNAFGRLDILVNNAGITRDNLLMKMSEEDFDAVVNTNLMGVFNCIKHIARQMLKQKSGRIINMSSVSGVLGNAGQANYCAAKAGVIGITKSAARELASRGITVNAVAPGFIVTEMTDVLSDSVK